MTKSPEAYDNRPWHEKPCSGSRTTVDVVFDPRTGKMGTPAEMGIVSNGVHDWVGNNNYRACRNCIEATQIRSKGKWIDAGYDWEFAQRVTRVARVRILGNESRPCDGIHFARMLRLLEEVRTCLGLQIESYSNSWEWLPISIKTMIPSFSSIR